MVHPFGRKWITDFNSLWWPQPPVILRYGVAVLSVTVALIIARLLDIYLVTAPVSLFLCAVMFSAWYGGLNPGLFAAALSLLAFIYYFVTPFHSLAIEISELPRTIIFTLSTLFVGFLSAAQRSATESLRDARDDLSRTVQELRRINEALQAENVERMRAEDTNRRLAAIFESTDDAVLSSSPEGIITSWNKGAERMYGYQAEEMVGQHVSVIIPADRAHEISNVNDLARLEESQRLETVRVRKDGQRIDVALTISAIKDSQDQTVGASVIARDITERKKLEEQKSRAARHAFLRAEVSAAFNESEGSLRAVLQVCAEAVVRHLDAAFARIWTLHADKKILELQASAGLYTNIDGEHARVPVGSHKIGLIAAERKPHLTNSVQEDERVSDKGWAQREGMVSFAGYPLAVEGRVVGVIAMFARHVLEQSTIEVLESIAPLIAQSVERTRAEEEVRQQANLLEQTHDAILVWEFPRTIVFWNRGAEQLYGFSREEAIGRSNHELLHTEHPLPKPVFEAVLEREGAWTGELTQTTRDGRKIVAESRHVLMREADGRRLVLETNNDITERKRAEAELRESEAYLAEAQRLSHMGSWVWRVPERDALHLSEEWYRIYGFDPEDGMPTWEELLQRIHPEDRAKWQGTLDQAITEKSDYEVEFRILLPGGSVKYIHTVGHPVLNASGDLVQFVGSSTDITERKHAEEKIRQQELELRQLIDLTPQHVAVLGPDRGRLFSESRLNINQAALDYHGLTFEEWQKTDPRKLFHPDDWDRIWNEDRSNFSKGLPYESEARLLRKDGQYRWFLFRHNPVHDEQGHVTRWYVAATDIQDRKQAEEKLRNENVALREEIDTASMFEEIVGTSPALQAVLTDVAKVAPTETTVLITGETGTGKELIARAIHKRSKRSNRAFVSVNCAAIPQSLIASELFGHEKGAFTGALQRRLGRFELAEGGTIFLDEIGELPSETQIALLRVLQEHEFERIGASRPIRVDVRVIVATNRDLQAAIRAGTFRSDLFYRINVFPIEMPPLRDRKEDIPLLVEYFIDRFARKAGKKIVRINKKTLETLQSYRWPGNIRELQNVIERSVIVCETDDFSVDESWLVQKDAQTAASQPLLKKTDTEVREMIEAALAETRGRVSGPSGAAAKLGIPASTLESKIRALKIRKDRFKSSASTTV